MEQVGALVLLSLLLMGFLFIYGPWQDFCADRARQRIFEVRDQIFDLAADGQLAFNSRQYQEIREALQALIRFAHDLTFVKAIALLLALGGRPKISPLFVEIEKVADPDLRKRLVWLVWTAHRAILEMMILRSPSLWIPALVLWCLPRRMLFRNAVDRAVKFVQSEAENADLVPPHQALRTAA